MPASYLHDVCDAVLDAAYAAVSEDRTGIPAPDRVFVAHGASEAHGCPNGQLTVHVENIHLRLSRLATTHAQVTSPKQPVVPTVPIVARLFRCVKPLEQNGAVPTAVDEDAVARQMMIDGWCLATGMWAAVVDPALFSQCQGVQLGDVVPLRSSGMYAGWAVTLTVGLSDNGPE